MNSELPNHVLLKRQLRSQGFRQLKTCTPFYLISVSDIKKHCGLMCREAIVFDSLRMRTFSDSGLQFFTEGTTKCEHVALKGLLGLVVLV